MKKVIYLVAIWGAAFTANLGIWILLWWVTHLAGGDNQATPFYGFTSGPGPMYLTAILGSTVLATLWHSLNCHEEECFRIGRHKVGGTPYCNKHHADARPSVTTEQLLTEQNELLREQNEILRARI